MSNLNTLNWCEPIHHDPVGVLDPSTVKLPSPFVVLVAGGSRGIGAGIARAYARAGASALVLAGRDPTTLEASAAQLREIKPDIELLLQPCDVTVEADVQNLAARTRERFNGRLDVLVINAGTATKLITNSQGLRDFPADLVQQSVEDFRRVMTLNVDAAFVLLHYLLPLLEESTSGAQSAVLVSSAAAHYIDPKVMAAGYSLSKFAATRLIEHVHEAHKGKGVSAFAVQPGGVNTDLADVPEGKGWEAKLIDNVELCGAFSVWLTKERRDWLSGRYLDSRWDVEELERRKDTILRDDLLKFRLLM